MRQIRYIVIHCSASDVPAHDDISVIRKWHVEENKWFDVGYHYFVKRNGTIQLGRPVWRQGAGVKGRNKDSIHICLSGNSNFTDEQVASAQGICKNLMNMLNIKRDMIRGHYELDRKKTCPNFEMLPFRIGV